MRFSEQFVRQVAQATDIVELVSQYVALTRRGKEHVGLCPFHDDNKPSLYVSPIKQIFKCFACGAGGGVFQFLMLYDKTTFPEAVKALAERANIPLESQPGRRDDHDSPTKDDLLKTVEFAAGFYQSQLQGDSGRGAMEYALGRGLSSESIKRFGIGYAPGGWDGLICAAAGRGMAADRLVASGLAGRNEQGRCYDRFRNRLMFPICDAQGRCVGFGGRALDPQERAKYLNSPESALFDKSGLLYALNWSREAIVSTGRAVVVEGYMDALMAVQHGLPNVVATMGTALTDRHVRLLSRYARQAVLVFDADTAGRAAADRGLELFLAQQLDVRVATIPAGKDPCDYCIAEGGEAMRRLIDEAPDALEYVWRCRQEALRQSGASLADRRRLIEEFLTLVVSSAAYGAIDGIRRGQLAQHIAHLLNVSAAELQQQMRRLARGTRGPARAEAGQAQKEPAREDEAAERHVLEVLLNDPGLFHSAAERIGPEDFVSPAYKRVAQVVWQSAGGGEVSLDDLLANAELVDQGGLLTDLAAAGEHRGNYEQTIHGAVDYILYRRNRQELRDLKASKDDDEALKRLARMLKAPDLRRRPNIR